MSKCPFADSKHSHSANPKSITLVDPYQPPTERYDDERVFFFPFHSVILILIRLDVVINIVFANALVDLVSIMNLKIQEMTLTFKLGEWDINRLRHQDFEPLPHIFYIGHVSILCLIADFLTFLAD